ncbi:MAG TPA: YlcI/YnfO family protein [Rudaea sp.]|jgi:hypothetical protein|nr:YlcI/YnfO family protein [Rudaea sp.]
MQRNSPLKNASIPPLRVDRALRRAAERALRDGETLSSFVEKSLRENIARRETQQQFIARGLTGQAEARRSGSYFSANAVLRSLKGTLTSARRLAAKRR